MIVAEPGGQAAFQPDDEPQNLLPTGLAVVVVVEGAYNGANHKSLGHCLPGQRIVIAPGPYAEDLLNGGLVTLPAGPEPVATPPPPPADTVRHKRGKKKSDA